MKKVNWVRVLELMEFAGDGTAYYHLGYYPPIYDEDSMDDCGNTLQDTVRDYPLNPRANMRTTCLDAAPRHIVDDVARQVFPAMY
jgi:hypothetical protein